MFTRNLHYAIAAATHVYTTSPTTTMYPKIKNLSGALPSNINQIGYWYQNIGREYESAGAGSLYYCRTSYTTHGGVVFGTGTATPTIDDYCLSGDLITTFSYTKSITVSTDDEGVILTGSYTITNTGDSAFTIGEVGLIAGSGSSNQTSVTYKCLIDRTVLDIPVTIPAGGVGQVTYTIRMNYPTT